MMDRKNETGTVVIAYLGRNGIKTTRLNSVDITDLLTNNGSIVIGYQGRQIKVTGLDAANI